MKFTTNDNFRIAISVKGLMCWCLLHIFGVWSEENFIEGLKTGIVVGLLFGLVSFKSYKTITIDIKTIFADAIVSNNLIGNIPETPAAIRLHHLMRGQGQL